MKLGARRHSFESPRIRLRSNAIYRVFTFHFSQFIVEILAHLLTDAVGIERRVIHRQSGWCSRVALNRLALHSFHPARVASKKHTNVVVRPVALVYPNLLPLPLGKVYQLRR